MAKPDPGLHDLVETAREPSRESRSLLARRIGEVCLASGRELSPREAELVYEILMRLLRAVERSVRQRLAANLAERRDPPRELILSLANDVIEVARPVLAKSQVLEDADLIDLILRHATDHHLAISEREAISESVSGTLLEAGDRDVAKALLRNEGARIDDGTMETLVVRSAHEPDLAEALVQRADLPEPLAMRMYSWVGEELRGQIEERFEEDATPLWDDDDDAVGQAVHDALEADLFGRAGERTDPVEEIGVYRGTSTDYRPHPRSLVRALKDGDVVRFEELFQDLTDMPRGSVARVLYDSGPEAVAIACKATAMERETFREILSLLHGGGNPAAYRQTPAFLKTVDYFDRIDRDGAARVLDAWRAAPRD